MESVKMGGLLLAAVAAMLASPVAAQEAATSTDVTKIIPDPATVVMPKLDFTETDADRADYDKYFYFHRADTGFEEALADLRECDEMAQGLQSGLQYQQVPYPYAGTMAGAAGGLLGSLIAEAVVGSANKRSLRRTNMRRCMGYKGYARYGLQKVLWQEFHFEEGFSSEEESKRQAMLAQQAKVASGTKPVTGGAGNMIARCLMIGAAALLLPSMSAAAAEKPAKKEKKEKWATKAITDKPQPVTLDPTKAYILVRSPGQIAPVLMRLPSDEAAAAHEADRAEAFARAHLSWRKRVASIELEAKVGGNDPSKRRKPTEPTLENFGYPSYEQKHTMYLGPQNRFSKVDGSVYLQEAPPGAYIFYAVGATCACLGTVSFDAPAGKVVALDLLPVNNPDGTTPFQLGGATFADARLPAESVLPAALKPAGPRGNWFGITVDRVMPVAGVFTYVRGKQVAEVEAAAVAAPDTPAGDPAAGQP